MNMQEIIMNNLMNNPNLKKVMDMVGDRDPKEVFIEECKKRGVDPDNILNMLKK